MQLDVGTNDFSKDWFKDHTTFASLMALTLKKSYFLVEDQMGTWLPTRFLAATIDVDDTGDLTCQNFFNEAKDPDNSTMDVEQICDTFPFDNLTTLYHVAMGNKLPDLKDPLIQMTNMTEKEFTNLYNVTDTKSLGHLIAQVD